MLMTQTSPKAREGKSLRRSNAKFRNKHSDDESEEEEVEIEESESDTPDGQQVHKEKSIAFEDEKFNLEKGDTLISYNMFQPFLEDFIHEHHEFVMLDTNGEFEEYLQQQDVIEEQQQEDTEADPLKKLINQYEELLKQDNFESEIEKESIKKLVSNLKKQQKDLEQNKTQNISKLGATSMAQSKEDLRMKGLKEIFHFYARQHIPHGIAFEQLVVIMNQVKKLSQAYTNLL